MIRKKRKKGIVELSSRYMKEGVIRNFFLFSLSLMNNLCFLAIAVKFVLR